VRIAIDMDGVIADVYAGIATADALGEAMREPGFFSGLKPIDGSLRGVRELAQKHDVVVVSSAMYVSHALAEKHVWLATYLPWLGPDRIVFCGKKRVVAADVLIDDSLYQLEEFPGHGILFASPLNANDAWPHRVEGWAQLTLELSAYAVR
jgi:5'(3')-deoxyribonucleotidase